MSQQQVLSKRKNASLVSSSSSLISVPPPSTKSQQEVSTAAAPAVVSVAAVDIKNLVDSSKKGQIITDASLVHDVDIDHHIPPIMDLDEKIHNLFVEISQCPKSDITPQKMHLYLKQSGIYLADEDFEQFMSMYDVTKSGTISFPEFSAFMIAQENHLRKAFEQANVRKNGLLELEDLKRVVKDLHIQISDKELTAMMSHVDKTKSNLITYAEFYDYMHRHQFVPLTSDKPISLTGLFHFWRDHVESITIDIGNGSFIPAEVEQEVTGQHPRWKYFLGGGLAASFSRTLTAPLDRLRCLLQVQNQIKAHGANVRSGVLEFVSIRQGFQEIGKGGWRSYWKGNGVNVLKSFPEIAIRSFLYETYKRTLTEWDETSEHTGEIDLHQRFAAGLAAAVCAQAIVYPMEFVKTRFVASSERVSIVSIIQNTIRTNGLRALYKGLCPSLIRVGADNAMFESLKKLHYNYHSRIDPDHRLPSIPALLVLGSTASVITQMTTYPLLLVRSRLQVQSLLQQNGVAATNYNGMTDALSQIVKKEGIKGLYRGATISCLKTVPSVTTTFVTFELLKRAMGIYSSV